MSFVESASGPMRAGGRATEAGMAFQAGVGTWLAAHLLARLPIGGRFGLANAAPPVSLRLETGEGLDDILVVLGDGSRIDVQCKTSATLSTSAASPLGKTITQVVRTLIGPGSVTQAIDPSKYRAVLAVAADASRSIDKLESGCRAFDAGGTWSTLKAQRSQKERDALDLFETHMRTAWSSYSTAPPSEDQLATTARLFRIVRFSMEEGGDNWREASRALGSRLYGSEAAGDAPLRDLKAIIRELIGNGAPADRDGLLRALRTRGHNDTTAADYDADWARLATASGAEIDRLSAHTCLPIDGGVSFARQMDGPLTAAIASGSLIVIGEPGAGKTGALVAFAQARRTAGDTVVFLSVDRFPGVALAADLQSELHLEHPLIEVLSAAPGSGPKLLIIDALDAARGGPAEGVFAQLIETLNLTRADQWTIAASIRTFDLKNGRRFRNAMRGAPPDSEFADPSLGMVRHFHVPRLSDDDLRSAGTAVAQLGSLIVAAPLALKDLLRNVFNLSLAAQLLADGASSESIRTVSTQSDLVDAYEDRRLVGTRLQQAAAAAVYTMISRRRLAVRKVDIDHDCIDDIIRSGVLSESGDLVSFSHHVLFDHISGRFFLDWLDPFRLIQQLGGDSSTALMLAPSLRFAIERFWRCDIEGKLAAWRLLAEIHASATVDPVLANVALRTASERVASTSDIAGLAQLIGGSAADAALAAMLARLGRFVGLASSASGSLTTDQAKAWATIAEAAMATEVREFCEPAGLLLHILFDGADLAEPELLAVFGRAARALLTFAWAADPPMQHVTTNAIRFVGKSFASDPAASRRLLDRALRDPHFSAHADKEATWLAEQIMPIARSDPDFAIEIYRVLYARDITDESTTNFGGRSRILPMASSRSQDYRLCRYKLGRKTKQLLDYSSYLGTRVVIEAALGNIDRNTSSSIERQTVSIEGRVPFDLLGDEHGFNAWDNPREGRGDREGDALCHYVNFLRACSIADFAESIEAAASGFSSPAVWARILGIAAERAADVVERLWPFACNINILTHSDTVRDAVRFLALAYPAASIEQRETFEIDVLRCDLFTNERELRRQRRALCRLLSLIDETALATDSMRTMRTDLMASGELGGNPPALSSTIIRGSDGGVIRDILADQGVDIDNGFDAEMMAQSEALSELVSRTPSGSNAPALATLWSATEATISMYDALAERLHERLEQPVWGHISNAVERIADSSAYAPESDGLPSIETLLAVLRRLWASRFPELSTTGEQGLNWSNWDVRVYAARAYMALVDRFGAEHSEIVDMPAAILADPVPQVRLQAAQIQVLSRIAPQRMWSLAEHIARNEPHPHVVAKFLNHALWRFTRLYAEQCEEIIEIVRVRRGLNERQDASEEDHIAAALGALTAQLWVWQARPKALQWLNDWAADPATHDDLLFSFLSELRGAFFARYTTSPPCDAPLADRAQRAGMIILRSCLATANANKEAILSTTADGPERLNFILNYRAAENLIHHLMSQIYFGSGADSNTNEPPIGLTSVEIQRRFLNDYRPMLELLACSNEPSTHHELVELYEFLISADPVVVFDALHGMLLGAGEREGYHYESIASAAIVRIITRYIADYRSIFEDESRRAHLLEILKLFSDVGWSEALKLLYDLPDLLR